MRTFAGLSTFLAFSSMAAHAEPALTGHNTPLDRPWSQRNYAAFLLEQEYHGMLSDSNPSSFAFPRPGSKSSAGTGPGKGWNHFESDSGGGIGISFVLAEEFRETRGSQAVTEAGVLSSGWKGPLSFFLDTRTFMELPQTRSGWSYDREFVETQDEETSGSVSYSSYSRYRANISMDTKWGRLVAARDGAHWGPGLFTNLVFSQYSLPFNQVTYHAALGPLSVTSLYGHLGLESEWDRDSSSNYKRLYAHRYEWKHSHGLTLGVSEQLILFNREAPFAFIPVVPLFIAKAYETETLNNGNIAFDADWKLHRVFRVYTEFLVDDVQSPASLFNDDWGNKWAWMIGIHGMRDMVGNQAGFIAEYARIEPWVYTHYRANTSQSSNYGYPLGNPAGPNSQEFVAKGYLRLGGRYYLALKGRCFWKGTDPGSSLDDLNLVRPVKTKSFLRGVGRPSLEASPYAALSAGRLSLYSEMNLGDGFAAILRAAFHY